MPVVFSKNISKNSSNPFAKLVQTKSIQPKTAQSKLVQTVMAVGLLSISAFSSAGIEPPSLDNTAYVLMDYKTGEILAEKNANKPLPPASLTKMMTSYIIEEHLEKGDLKEDDQVLMSENAWCHGSSRQSCMFVPVNTTASAIDMLRGIIIQSGNDASIAMAEHLAGSEAAFSELMNNKAKELGMKNSHFVNATGMPARGHFSSAMDLAILARAIIGNGSKYYDIYSEKEFTYNKITQANRNSLLMTDPSVDGLKTGHTNAAGYCLVASSERNGMRLISVIMGTKSMKARTKQSRELLNWGFGHFKTITKAPKGQFVSKIPVWFGTEDEVEVATGDALQILTTKTQQTDKIKTVMKLNDNVEAPINKGQSLGKLQAVMDGQVVASVDVVATHNVEEAGMVSKVWQHIVRWFKELF